MNSGKTDAVGLDFNCVAFQGNCKNKMGGMECEVGLRRKTYNVLTGLRHNFLWMNYFAHYNSSGSVLSVWTLVESVLTNDGQKKGQHAKMQVGFLNFL